MQPFAWILAALAGAAATVPLVRLRRARCRRLAALALRHGWTYSPDDPWNLSARLTATLLGSFGHDRRASDVFTVPTAQGVLWLAIFSRQMGAGRRRRTERYALVMASCRQALGGIAVLPADQPFVPAGAFGRYRKVDLAETHTARAVSAWAERPDRERHLVLRLAELVGRLERSAGAEVRSRTAVVYWPLDRGASEQTYADLAEVGRQLLGLLAWACSDAPGDGGLTPQAERENR